MRIVTGILIVLLFIGSIASSWACGEVFEISKTTDSALHEIEALLFGLISAVQLGAATVALAIITRYEPPARRSLPIPTKYPNEEPPKDTRMNMPSMSGGR